MTGKGRKIVVIIMVLCMFILNGCGKETDRKLIELAQKLEEADGKLIELDQKLEETDGKLIELDQKLEEAHVKLSKSAQKSEKVDEILDEIVISANNSRTGVSYVDIAYYRSLKAAIKHPCKIESDMVDYERVCFYLEGLKDEEAELKVYYNELDWYVEVTRSKMLIFSEAFAVDSLYVVEITYNSDKDKERDVIYFTFKIE